MNIEVWTEEYSGMADEGVSPPTRVGTYQCATENMALQECIDAINVHNVYASDRAGWRYVNGTFYAHYGCLRLHTVIK